ncbi:MAG: ABC transporter substrate-binding protein [Ekhidna sp.]|nr:ABC transporter substrate-binding protein [Ekhidna sp.]MBC6427329.1 ABC transporter substrate-binding protein [Ekhidna sp.]
MKVCSFLPAVTQMIYDMGLERELYGVTFECPEMALKEKERVVRCVLEGTSYSSKEIDEIFSRSKADGESLYYINEDALQAIQPDLIFTQNTCEVCQIDTSCTSAAVAKLEKEVELVEISPDSFEDVIGAARLIAAKMGRLDAFYDYEQRLRNRIRSISNIITTKNLTHRKVSLIEWIDPIYNCGHWIPDQINLAGGDDALSNPCGDSYRITWEILKDHNPEVLVLAPCGYRTKRSLMDMPYLTEKKEWDDLMAVKNNEVYIIDFELFTQPSASTLVDGIELLAYVFHPEYFSLPSNLKDSVLKFDTQLITL